MTDRNAVITAFLERPILGRGSLAGAERRPLAGDASARRYERVRPREGASLILMDTPNPALDLAPFLVVAGLLHRHGLSAPAVHAVDEANGLALLEDFGDETFAARLDSGADPTPLYGLATDVLVHLHRHFRLTEAQGLGLPLYDSSRFTEQALLFADVYVPAATGKPLAPDARAEFAAAWTGVLRAPCAEPPTLLLRDYHAGNLMLLPDQPGVKAAGLLDFQDAGLGPAAYDLVSLLEDARRDVPADLAEAMVRHYLSAFPILNGVSFRRAMVVLGAVRHTRVLAVFVRLASAGKRGYLRHLPRVWRLLDGHLHDPGLAPVAAWFDRHVPPEARDPNLFAEPE